jgi:phospholipase/carboxylesterase
MSQGFTPSTQQADQIRSGPSNADRRLVLLHGWGADANDLFELGAMLTDPPVSVVALQAPLTHPTGQGRQWYDLQQPQWPQLPEAREDLRRRLLELHQELPLERTVLLGFSQGAAMALDVATDGLIPAGVVSCSGYPHPNWKPTADQRPPVLLTHGREDPVVPFAASEELQRQLVKGGRPVQLLGFSGGHSIDEALLPELRRFLIACWS